MGDAARDWGGSFWDFELGLTRPWKRSTGSVVVHGAESTGDARVQRRRRDKGGAAFLHFSSFLFLFFFSGQFFLLPVAATMVAGLAEIIQQRWLRDCLSFSDVLLSVAAA
jgi:hypothetical protein